MSTSDNEQSLATQSAEAASGTTMQESDSPFVPRAPQQQQKKRVRKEAAGEKSQQQPRRKRQRSKAKLQVQIFFQAVQSFLQPEEKEEGEEEKKEPQEAEGGEEKPIVLESNSPLKLQGEQDDTQPPILSAFGSGSTELLKLQTRLFTNVSKTDMTSLESTSNAALDFATFVGARIASHADMPGLPCDALPATLRLWAMYVDRFIVEASTKNPHINFQTTPLQQSQDYSIWALCKMLSLWVKKDLHDDQLPSTQEFLKRLTAIHLVTSGYVSADFVSQLDVAVKEHMLLQASSPSDGAAVEFKKLHEFANGHQTEDLSSEDKAEEEEEEVEEEDSATQPEDDAEEEEEEEETKEAQIVPTTTKRAQNFLGDADLLNEEEEEEEEDFQAEFEAEREEVEMEQEVEVE